MASSSDHPASPNPPGPPDPPAPSEGGRIDRRRFFREGLFRLFQQAEKKAEPLKRIAAEFAKLESPPLPPSPTAATPVSPTPHANTARPVTLALVLRPPGALPETDFLSTCSRCGKCAEACPAECIVLDPQTGSGAPHILAERKPCVMCDDRACMNVCPSGALQLLPRFSIRMGRAVWGEGKCTRGDGSDCRACLDVCPMGTAALELTPDNRIEVKDACTGCGQCQYVCPTTPRAIVVVPTPSIPSAPRLY